MKLKKARTTSITKRALIKKPMYNWKNTRRISLMQSGLLISIEKCFQNFSLNFRRIWREGRLKEASRLMEPRSMLRWDQLTPRTSLRIQEARYSTRKELLRELVSTRDKTPWRKIVLKMSSQSLPNWKFKRATASLKTDVLTPCPQVS